MRLLARLPLRILLVAATTLLVACGLLASSAAVTLTMRAQLVNEVDNNLFQAMHEWAFDPTKPRPGDLGLQNRAPHTPGTPSRERPPSPYFVAVRTADGTLLLVVDDQDSAPRLPDHVQLGTPFELDDASGDGKWRALAAANQQGDVTLLAVPLEASVDSTVDRLVKVEALVGGVVLVLVGTAAWFLVRRSLRPLQDVEATAHEIAAGNLDRRLPALPTNTEVGSLSASFNGMAERIEAAFAETATAARQAEQSEGRMRRFVADAGHELRTPLTSIIGFAELYRSGMLPDADAAFARIEPEARRMQALVEDLLTLARLDAERPMSREPVDLPQVAADAVAAARAIAPGRPVELRLDAAPVITGDPNRLRQVALNLVVNALRHAGDDAHVTVTVGDAAATAATHSAAVGHPARPGTPVAVFEVRDDGVGLDPDDAARCFERFHVSDDSRTRGDGKGGSGLGLSIVAGIVAAHGGAVYLDTAPGAGATFRVELPLE